MKYVITTWYCKPCQKAGLTLSSRSQHIRYFHDKRTRHAMYKCEACDLKWATIDLFQTHLDVEHFIYRYSCSVCQQTFDSYLKARMHMEFENCEDKTN